MEYHIDLSHCSITEFTSTVDLLRAINIVNRFTDAQNGSYEVVAIRDDERHDERHRVSSLTCQKQRVITIMRGLVITGRLDDPKVVNFDITVPRIG